MEKSRHVPHGSCERRRKKQNYLNLSSRGNAMIDRSTRILKRFELEFNKMKKKIVIIDSNIIMLGESDVWDYTFFFFGRVVGF